MFDGHAGAAAARYLAEQDRFVKTLISLTDFRPQNIERQFIAFDQQLLTALGDKEDGSTCTSCLIEPSTTISGRYNVHVFNVGDSRTLIIRSDGTFELLTIDHKPSVPSEKQRIIAAGGFVSDTDRVDGKLSVSRAFGDRPLKTNHSISADKQKVTALPDIRVIQASPGDCILLACDGLFEVWTCDQLVSRIRSLIKRYPNDPATALARLLDENERSDDNTTAVLVELVDGRRLQGPASEFVPGPIVDEENAGWVYAYYLFAEQLGFSRSQTDEIRRANIIKDMMNASGNRSAADI